ncbi:MAG: TlpA family protein disulfide reductase [Deltaproteobacteria bacterium]|nr:TlpA family protein disulfide reductase [Deltaproteobacteria bacterium]
MRLSRTHFALVVAALALAPAAGAEEDLPVEGQPAPAFQLRALNPEASGAAFVSLDRFAGDEPEDPGSRAVLLSFFASWCAPCQKEMPYLQQLHQMYRDQGLRVLSVNIDREEEGVALARRQIRAAKVTYPVLGDRFNLLARRYLGEQSSLPSVFIIRRDGTIARIERGYGKDARTFLLAEVQRALGISRPEEAASK